MNVIGLDVGTSRVKAVRFDDEWAAVDVAAEASTVRRGSDGRREQDMLEVWASVARVLTAVATRSRERVDLVAVTAQGDGCWLLDEHAQPIAPAMLWNDSRAAPIIEQWQRDGRLDAAFRINGCQAAPGLANAQLSWLRTHQPEVIDRARTLTSCAGWIYTQLTGRVVLDASEAANPFFDAVTGRYAPELLELFDLAELGRLLPEVITGSGRLAAPRAGLAVEMGLDPGVHIALAPYDVPATAIGTGAVRPGQAFAILGTTLCVGSVADDPLLDREPTGMTLPGSSPGQWLIAYATMVGTEVLDWAAALLGRPDAAAVITLAEQSQRIDLPLFLPYLSPAGERSPFLDTTMRGSLTGVDTGHTPADIARAIVDGLSLVVVDCLKAGARPRQLALSGGGAAGDLWCQCIADAAGVPVIRPDVPEVGARGAAISAASDAGVYLDLEHAVAAAVRPGKEFAPRPVETERYTRLFDRFLAFREAVRRSA